MINCRIISILSQAQNKVWYCWIRPQHAWQHVHTHTFRNEASICLVACSSSIGVVGFLWWSGEVMKEKVPALPDLKTVIPLKKLCRHISCFRCRWGCWINTSTPPLAPYAYWWYWWWSRVSHARRHICQRAPARCECSNASNLIGICKAGVFQCPKFEKLQCLEEDTLKKCCWLRPGKGVSMSQMREALCLWACIFKTRQWLQWEQEQVATEEIWWHRRWRQRQNDEDNYNEL